MRLLFSSLSSAASVLLCCVAVSSGFAQTKPLATSVISGRVMIGEKPAVGVMVGLVRVENTAPTRGGAIIKDATDNDGRYRLTQVPAGNYRVTTLAPVYVSPIDSPGFYEQGKTVQLGEGETVENLDFKLIRGGVISGKVTDTSGKPLIEERLSVWKIEPGGRKGAWNSVGTNYTMMMTDDRGVYRIYGLPEGRYLISAGTGANFSATFQRSPTYRRTFYPDVTDEAQAKPIEVAPGSESKDIDLRLGADKLKGNVVTIRTVDAETGAPLPGLNIAISIFFTEQQASQIYSQMTDAAGVVRLEKMMPGRYGATLSGGGASPIEYFSETTRFEVQDSDVENVEVRAQLGAILTGKVVIEGSDDPSLLAKLLELRMGVYSAPARGSTPAPPRQIIVQNFKVNPDGSFRIPGLAPGQVWVNASALGGVASFTLMRMEVDGLAQKDGIGVVAGQQVDNVRLVFGYGQATVRGEVKIVNGTLPDGARVSVSARRTDGQNIGKGATVDARGRFVLEAMLPGEYDLTLTASPRMIVAQGPDGNFGTSNQPTPGLPRSVRQKITVPVLGEVTVSFTLDLTPRERQR